jgi:CDP-diacylglycerol--serine O-phosphatidyltransferase
VSGAKATCGPEALLRRTLAPQKLSPADVAYPVDNWLNNSRMRRRHWVCHGCLKKKHIRRWRVPGKPCGAGRRASHRRGPHRLRRKSGTLRTMTLPKPNKPFSMIREFHLADWFTLANAVCGIGALFSMMTYLQTNDTRHVYLACGLVLAAFIFDVFDGRIARWRQKTSVMGRELDSLADVISFGVAPAVIAYGCGMQGLYDRIVLAGFVACGVSRLARYNVTAEALSGAEGKVKYFEGTPIPTSLLLVALLFVAAWQGALQESLWFGEVVVGGFTLHPLVLLFALSGSLMVSRIKVPKF